MTVSSERECANRMYSIAHGSNRLTYSDYQVEEVAERYGVHRDTVYRGIRSGDPMYPDAQRLGNGPKAGIVVLKEDLEACDERRIAFYKTTPSWMLFEGLDFKKPPPRRSARSLLMEMRELPQRKQPFKL